jgi:hypothetical protein
MNEVTVLLASGRATESGIGGGAGKYRIANLLRELDQVPLASRRDMSNLSVSLHALACPEPRTALLAQ